MAVDGQTARFIRPGLTEEYSVSVDGVRQDFVVLERPEGAGHLRVELDVTGARDEPLVNGARLVLNCSGRKIAYSRLRATDARGKELAARIEAASSILPGLEGAHPAARMAGAKSATASLSDTPSSAGLEAPALWQARIPAARRLAVVVDDADALYPVRIDPTFSDDNWVSMSSGAEGGVSTAVVDSAGNLYIGSFFTSVGSVMANHVAKWNGSSWSALGVGVDSNVYALAVSGGDLYVGGKFTAAGGSPANHIAKWNGSSWSTLGSGVNDVVGALAVSGSVVYAGGQFTTAGGSPAIGVARWSGSSWSALGSGIGGPWNSAIVNALAVSGSAVYAGGQFLTAFGSPANNVAKWNGSSWSALGSGVDGMVDALAVSGSTLYAGGWFETAGGSPANHVAKWNGSSWSALGTGVDVGWVPPPHSHVDALAVSGSELYVGGLFTMAGGSPANYVAKWNGSSWSALGSGVNDWVLALAVSGSDLYVCGFFTTAGGKKSDYLARATVGPRDTTPPTVTITSPTLNQRWSNAVFTVKGKAKDNGRVASVWCLTNGVWGLAIAGNGWTNWSVDVALVPGTNVVKAYAVDAGGNHSTTNSASLLYVVSERLAVQATGPCTMAPNYSSAMLEIGKTYTTTVTPGKGYVFSDWAGSVLGNVVIVGSTPKLSFTGSSRSRVGEFSGAEGSFRPYLTGANEVLMVLKSRYGW
jgi:hypothetical protein